MTPWRRRRREEEVGDDALFEEAVRAAALAISSAVVSYDTAGEVVLSGMRLNGVVDLRNVRQLCATQEPDQWPETVAEHLTGLATMQIRPRGYDNLDRVRPLLRSRLYAEADAAFHDDAVRLVAPGVVEALVLVEGSLIRTVPQPALAGWAADLEDLLALGRAQVRQQGLLPVRNVDLEGVVLQAVEGGSFFTTTHAFWLHEYVEVPPDGVLVALPNRHLLLAHPLRDATAVAAVEALLVNAHQFYDQGPGSLSPHLYWWRGGALDLLPAAVSADAIEFRPPPEFVAVLDRLRAPR